MYHFHSLKRCESGMALRKHMFGSLGTFEKVLSSVQALGGQLVVTELPEQLAHNDVCFFRCHPFTHVA